MWKKVGRWKLRCNRRLTFSLCGKNGEWDTASGVGTNVGEKLVGKIVENIGIFLGKFCFRNGLGTSGRAELDLCGPVGTILDRFLWEKCI